MKIKFLTLLISVLALSACGITTTKTTTTPETKKDVFTSIRDAVTKQLTLKCTYENEGQKTTTYIKGQQVRFTSMNQEEGVEGVIKDNKFYFWNSKDKTGMVFDISQTEADKNQNQVKSVDEVISELEAKKDNCTVSPESASMFEIPTDIKFTDTSSFFKDGQ